MKNLTTVLKYQFAMLVCLFSSAFAFAQEEATKVATSSTNTTTTTTQWYTEPWVWIAGAVLFIILIAALIGGRSNTTISRTTVHKDV